MTIAQLSVTLLPSSLFSGSSNGVVQGSVIWLYCEVNSVSSTLSVTWNKDGGPLVQDVPHIRLRTSNSSSSTTLLLVIDNVVSSDAGLYQCTAQDEMDIATGDVFNMTVVPSAAGTLEIVSQDPLTVGANANRTAASNGDSISLSFIAGHVGDDMINYNPPTAQWYKDGVPVTYISTDMAVGINGRLSSTLSFTFQESDAGVYHCIFTDSNSRIFGAFPLRIDTGVATVPEKVSPPIVYVQLSGKLVVEVATSGAYGSLSWSRNTVPLGSPSAPATLSEFINFAEIFVREPVTASDYGLYDAVYSGGGGVGTEILVAHAENPITAVTGDKRVSVRKGRSIAISCTSTGGPIPLITWTFNSQITNFNQTDVSTDPVASINNIPVTITPGSTMSTLHIVNAQFPTHNGVYTCTGTNSISGSEKTSSATITVQVREVPPIVSAQVPPEGSISVTGSTVLLSCTATTPDLPITFTWTDPMRNVVTPLSGSATSSNISITTSMSSNYGTYTCMAINRFGSDSDTVTLVQAVAPIVSLGVQDLLQSPEVLGGSSLELSVNITSFNLPLTSITWSYNGNILTSGQDKVTITNPSLSDPAPVVSVLIRTPLTSLDAGNYSAMATNPENSSSYTFHVTVNDIIESKNKIRRGENPPTILNNCLSEEFLDDVYTNFFTFLSQEFGAGIVGRTKQLHASSCDQVLNSNPWSKSGLYWIRNDTKIVEHYCVFG